MTLTPIWRFHCGLYQKHAESSPQSCAARTMSLRVARCVALPIADILRPLSSRRFTLEIGAILMHASQLRFLGVTMVGAYIALNILMLALRPITAGMPPLAATALVVPPMVLAMVYLIIPIAKRA